MPISRSALSIRNIVPNNPVHRKYPFLDENNNQDRVLAKEEEKLYLLAASQPLRDIATLMLEQGMRPEEVCRIRRENVRLEQGYLFNPYGKTKAARRKLWLSKASTVVLTKRLEQEGEYLFKGRVEGKPIVKVNGAHTATLKRCGVARFRLYDLRHTFATRAAEQGIDLVTLAAILGHSKIEMVMLCPPDRSKQDCSHAEDGSRTIRDQYPFTEASRQARWILPAPFFMLDSRTMDS
jgi:integrase